MARTIIASSPGATLTARSNTPVNTEGVVESVEDVVSLISPYETPFYSMMRKVPANDVVHYWQADDLAAASRTNAKPYGYEPAAANGADFDSSTPAMLQNWTQLQTKTARVSGSMRGVRTYGRGDELDYQIMKRGRELRRDAEATFLADRNGGAGTSTAPGAGFPFAPGGTAPLMTSASYLIRSTCHNYGATGNVTGTAGSAVAPITVTNGTNRALTETILLAAQKAAYDQGGQPNTILCSPYHSQVIANFAYVDPSSASASAARVREIMDNGAGKQELVNVVDIYRSPYGTMAVLQDRFIYGTGGGAEDNEGIVLLLEVDRWHVAQLREMQTEPLAKTGDNTSALVLVEHTLVHEHTGSSACIRDLLTA